MSNPADMVRPGTPLTSAERRALEAYASHGTYKGAAAAIGRSTKTVQHQLAAARIRLGVTTSIEAYRRLRDEPA